MYVYEFADGTRAIITDSEEMTQWIRTLHLMDDAEVYNNIKNNKVSDDKSDDGSETNWTLSIDGLMTDNPDDSVCALQIADASEDEDPIAELVLEKVAELSEENQELYRLYFTEGRTQREIAELKGIAHQTICKKISRLQNKLIKLCRENF